MRHHTHVPQAAHGRRFTRGGRVITAAALATALGLSLSACSSSADDGAGDGDELTQVTYALDWAPNTNHIGLYVADELGYFEDAGLDVEFLPYASTASTQLVSAGEADFGSGGQSSVTMGRTAGLDIVSVYRTTQVDTGRLVALASRDDITRPADLDGKIFGGFGNPVYTALAQSTIAGDGGQGDFEEVSIDTGAYEAMAQGRVDFTLSVATWEDLQAEIDGHPYTAFSYQDFGVPNQQSTGIVSSQEFLDAHPDVAKAFVQATKQGYQYAVDHPDEAADLLIQANEDTLGTASELVHKSAELMATGGFFVTDGRPIGAADADAWKGYGEFLFNGGFLSDASGETPAEEPDWTTYYTDEYL